MLYVSYELVVIIFFFIILIFESFKKWLVNMLGSMYKSIIYSFIYLEICWL